MSGDKAVVHWLADYALFGRPIHNNVTATLVVKNGKIVTHEDVYSWKNWARQAFPLGPVSNWWPVKQVLMGGLNLFLKAKITLDSWMKPAPKAEDERAKESKTETARDAAAESRISKTAGLNGALGRELEKATERAARR